MATATTKDHEHGLNPIQGDGIVESAVFELARKGLLHRPDGSGLITPPRTILRYDELLDLSNI